MKEPEPDKLYVVEGHLLEKVRRVALRLFSDITMHGDEMRDAAQMLEVVVDNAFEYEPKKGA